MMRPAKGNGARVRCPIVKRRHLNKPDGLPVGNLVRRAQKDDQFEKDHLPACCTSSSSVTVPVLIPMDKVEAADQRLAQAMKYVQDGPSIYTQERNALFGRRNAVEAMNGTFKGPLGAFVDDPRTRPMRGWAGQLFLTSLAAAGTNHRLIASAGKDEGFMGGGPEAVRPTEAQKDRLRV